MVFVNIQADSNEVTLFWYSPAVNIAAAYPNCVPLRNSVCIFLMDAPKLANYFIFLSIDVWVVRPTTLVVFFARISSMILSKIFMEN